MSYSWIPAGQTAASACGDGRTTSATAPPPTAPATTRSTSRRSSRPTPSTARSTRRCPAARRATARRTATSPSRTSSRTSTATRSRTSSALYQQYAGSCRRWPSSSRPTATPALGQERQRPGPPRGRRRAGGARRRPRRRRLRHRAARATTARPSSARRHGTPASSRATRPPATSTSRPPSSDEPRRARRPPVGRPDDEELRRRLRVEPRDGGAGRAPGCRPGSTPSRRRAGRRHRLLLPRGPRALRDARRVGALAARRRAPGSRPADDREVVVAVERRDAASPTTTVARSIPGAAPQPASMSPPGRGPSPTTRRSSHPDLIEQDAVQRVELDVARSRGGQETQATIRGAGGRLPRCRCVARSSATLRRQRVRRPVLCRRSHRGVGRRNANGCHGTRRSRG